MNSVNIKKYFLGFCRFELTTQPDPTRGLTQPMDNSDIIVLGFIRKDK